ncbi:hypothetical protein Trydic_g1400 [Trypoxylus dichotomus]
MSGLKDQVSSQGQAPRLSGDAEASTGPSPSHLPPRAPELTPCLSDVCRSPMSRFYVRGGDYASSSSIGIHNGRIRLRRRRGERRNIQFYAEKCVHRAMVVITWDVIACGSRFHLMFIQGTRNVQHYVDEVVESHIFPYLLQLEDSHCQKDNAHFQVTRSSLNLFKEAHVPTFRA